ncbi:MAG TPA: alpha-galactosidase [Phototrophicaceae bacterium]|nr:alpha-galactosidase [Phototrophicaceae bacterium]
MPITTRSNFWILETHSTAYALGINWTGTPVHAYWGARLPYAEDYPAAPAKAGWASFSDAAHLTPEEYPGYAGMKFIEPCLKVTFADGVRDVVLTYDKADIQGEELTIHLLDAHYKLRVEVHYRVHADYDLIERWAIIRNEGAQPVKLERVWSAQWHLPVGDQYRLTHLTGRWADETHLRREPLVQGVKVLESRRLTTSHHHNPWFAVDSGSADEEHGDVWFGLLQWSGNWKIAAEVTDFQSTRVNIGLNDWDFAWELLPGEQFVTPASFAGYTLDGFGAASRHLHDFIRDTILPHGQTPHKVFYNSWEATTFNVDVASQIQLAELAAQMGIELFVMDDGWFQGRNDDTAGLGDWWPDAAKFPNGLTPLIERVNALDMDFGLWVEPEMVNANSDLYRAHPDWVIHFPTRARSEARNQMILNFARPDVQDNIFTHLDKLLSKYNIAFIKWDMNRNISEPGWPEMGHRQQELWVRYVEGVYRVWGQLRERHPNVIWQSCSGGGGRADAGILRLADQIWISDNTEAPARLHIQEGFSQVYPANTMEAWVTDSGDKFVPLSFKFHVSMCGSLGVGGHLLHWTEAERAEAARWIALYKDIRPLVQFGDQYRLRSPHAHAFSAVQYMSKDKSEGVLFAFRTHLPNPAQLPLLYLRGLEPDVHYTIKSLNETRSGAAWMHAGLEIMLSDFQSGVYRIQRV